LTNINDSPSGSDSAWAMAIPDWFIAVLTLTSAAFGLYVLLGITTP
jgi:hypothetical protein